MARILTTHVGSLPRNHEVVDLVVARVHVKPFEEHAFAAGRP